MSLPDQMSAPDPDCPYCRGTGWVCEAHPDRPSDCSSPDHPDACRCGAPGTPCRECVPAGEFPGVPDGFIPHEQIN
jgi:hypothetical protein